MRISYKADQNRFVTQDMKIVQVIPDYNLGGIQKAGCVLAARMAQLGHEAVVVGRGTGGRHRPDTPPRLKHISLPDFLPETVLSSICEISPDVVHIHSNVYEEPLIRLLHERFQGSGPLVISTPVFGRPPLDHEILKQTRTCCVGEYTFYRLCRWLRVTGDWAIGHGMGYVPLTPYEPPVSALPLNGVAVRRLELGVPPEAFVVGRIGRDAGEKWSPAHEEMINDLLTRLPHAYWLSVGFPEVRGRSRLIARWSHRFIDFPETADYEFLVKVLSSMDVCLFFSPHGECFASSICEAICTGTPTIAVCTPVNDNGQTEQILDGVTGFLVSGPQQAMETLVSLESDPERLAALKLSARAYGQHHWHVNRVCENLLSLYEWYLDDRCPEPIYAGLMREEHHAFARTYKRRIVSHVASGPLDRLRWFFLLNIIESWPLFKVGRFLKALHGRAR